MVYRVGEYLIQLERGANYGYYGGQDTEPRLLVSSVDDSDTALTTLNLPVGRVSGSVLVGDSLIIAQSNFEPNEGTKGEWENAETFTTMVIDISEPLAPEIIGTASKEWTHDAFYYGSNWDFGGEFLEDGTLVWYPQEETGYFYYDVGWGRGDARIGYPYGGASGRVYTVSIEDRTEPRILSSTSLWEPPNADTDERTYWREGSVELAGSSVFYGLTSSESVEQNEGPDKWLSQHWVGHLDLVDPEVPVMRQLVKIPGVFEHAWLGSNSGVVLFTSAFRSYLEDEKWLSEQSIQALAYDGVQAYLLDELVSQTTYYGPKLFEDEFILLGEVDYGDNDVTTELTTYEWLGSGRFQKHQSEQVPGAVYRLGVVGDLLVIPANGALSFVDFRDPAADEKAIVVVPITNYWQSIDLIQVFERSFAYVPLGWAGVELVDFDGVFGESNDSLELPSLQDDSQEEWTSISLDLLTLVRAESDLVVAGLAVDEPWAFTDEVPQMVYADWMRHALGLESGDAVPEAALDSDGDGLSNAMEYLTGSHPGDSEDANAVESWVFETQEGRQYVEMRSQVNIHATGGGELTPQYSNDLREWSISLDEFEVVEELFNPAKTYRYSEALEPGQPVFLRFLLKTD